MPAGSTHATLPAGQRHPASATRQHLNSRLFTNWTQAPLGANASPPGCLTGRNIPRRGAPSLPDTSTSSAPRREVFLELGSSLETHSIVFDYTMILSGRVAVLRRYSLLQPTATDGVAWSVCRYVCRYMYVTIVNPAKTAESIDIWVGTWTPVGRVLDRGPGP